MNFAKKTRNGELKVSYRMEIKHNDVIVWKGFKWSRLLKVWDLDNIATLLIQLVTLSRYRHTAIYYKYLEREYLVHSGAKKGIHIQEITGEEWFRSNISNNVYDLFRFRFDHNKKTAFERAIQSQVTYMYNYNEKSSQIGSYSFIGIFNQFLLNVFNKSILKKTKPTKMFCSEMTHYYFTEDDESFKISPFNLVDCDYYKKIK